MIERYKASMARVPCRYVLILYQAISVYSPLSSLAGISRIHQDQIDSAHLAEIVSTNISMPMELLMFSSRE